MARCRRIFGQRRVGHAGTLDPDATGVLLVGLGRATRLLRFLTALPKTYTTDIVLGTATSTLDASGEVVGTYDIDHVTPEMVQAAAAALTGDIEQVPPMVSAVKVGGRRLHELARQGIEVERPARSVTVYRFDTMADPARPGVYRAEVVCSSGTYIRVLAHDLGQALGGGAHVANLRRTRIGSFGEADMRPLDAIGPDGVLTPAQAMRDLDAVTVDLRGRGLDPHRTAPRPGAARGGGRRALGHARRAGELAGRLRGDRHRPHPAGRRAGRAVTVDRLPSVAMSRTRNRRHDRGLRRGPSRAPCAACATSCARARRPASPRWWSPSTATRPRWCVPGPRPKQLTGLEQKLELLADCGIDRTVVVPFDMARAEESAEDFVKEVLVDELSARLVVVGEDFHFGHGRRGNVELLRRLGAEYGFEVVGVGLTGDGPRTGVLDPHPGACSPRATWRGRPGCSAGRTRSAASWCAATGGAAPNWGSRPPTWPWPTTSPCPPTLSTPGTTRGPTARCTRRPSRWGAGPPSTSRARRRYWWRPTSCTSTAISTGSAARVSFAHRLRDEQRFDSIEALVAQMRADVEATERVLASADLP